MKQGMNISTITTNYEFSLITDIEYSLELQTSRCKISKNAKPEAGYLQITINLVNIGFEKPISSFYFQDYFFFNNKINYSFCNFFVSKTKSNRNLFFKIQFSIF